MNSYWGEFIATRPPEDIAKHLLRDAAHLNEGNKPSLLAVHIPNSSTPAGKAIAAHLTPSPDVHIKVKKQTYQKLRSRLQDAIQTGGDGKGQPAPDDGYLLAGDSETIVEVSPLNRLRRMPPDATEPTKEEVETTLRVLRYVSSANRNLSPVLQGTVQILEQHFNTEGTEPSSEELKSVNWTNEITKFHAQRHPTRQRVCYQCQFLLVDVHPHYHSMCQACGDFNFAGSAISLPHSLKLPGQTALVTGARINLGYYTALRLLRCGALVIASTRYPNDAAIRYAQEPDFDDWKDRLKVVGADFRRARDAFALVEATKSALRDWGAKTLNILINNAAQTLTDSITKEKQAVRRDQQLLQEAEHTNLIIHTKAHHPEVRAGVSPLTLYGGDIPPTPSAKALTTPLPPSEDIILPSDVKDDGRAELQPYFKSSWVQTLSEIPYEDIVSAHAVNAFVPLLLIRELLPIMGSPTPVLQVPTPAKSKHCSNKARKPLGHIVNVSAREGMFESRPKHARKNGTHVHTNMAKAALNMITQTEAASAWKTRSVAMNTVDPGYLSAAPEMDGFSVGGRPIGWEDGAGRVLWSVAIGETEGRAVWGRFLKDYGAVDVDGRSLNRG